MSNACTKCGNPSSDNSRLCKTCDEAKNDSLPKPFTITGKSEVGNLDRGSSTGVEVGKIEINVGNGRPAKSRRQNPQPQPPLRGPEAYLTCNRENPTTQFRRGMETYLDSPNASGVHLYIVQGTKEDCPGSFINRLWKYELNQLAVEMASIRWDHVPKVRKIEVDWQCRQGETPDDALVRLQDNILQEIGRNEAIKPPGIPTGPDFYSRVRRLAQQYDVIVICHSIADCEWHLGMEELLKRYINLLVDVSEMLPLCLLFFTLERTPLNPLKRLLGRKQVGNALAGMQRMFQEATSTPTSFRYSILEVLDEVDKKHVTRWLRNSDNEIRDTEIEQKLSELFAKRSRVKMKEIENYFNKTPGPWQNGSRI